MGRVVGKRPLDKGGKGGVRERLGEVQREGNIMGRNWACLGGENSRLKAFWGRWQANRCFRCCRGEGFCAGGMVARQTAPGCTRCVRTEKGSARTKPAWAEATRTGVYIISAWNVWGTGRTGCNRAQGSFFADVPQLHFCIRRLSQYVIASRDPVIGGLFCIRCSFHTTSSPCRPRYGTVCYPARRGMVCHNRRCRSQNLLVGAQLSHRLTRSIPGVVHISAARNAPSSTVTPVDVSFSAFQSNADMILRDVCLQI